MRTTAVQRYVLLAGAMVGVTGSVMATPPPATIARIYSSQNNVPVVGLPINSPFNGGFYGGPGFLGLAVNNTGAAYVHVSLYGQPPPPLPPSPPGPIFHNSNHAILFTGASGNDLTPFLGGGVEPPDPGSVSVPSTNYIYDESFWTAMNNNGSGVFGLRLGASTYAMEPPTPITGVYFNKSAMPIKEGDAVTATGVALGTVFGAVGPARIPRYQDGSPLTSTVQINDNNVILYAGVVIENGVSKRAILKVALNGSGAVVSETLVAKEGGPVGAGPDTWTALWTTPNTCAINNSGDVIFSGTTASGVNGVYRTSGATGSFVAVGGGPAPTGSSWGYLAGTPVDINNSGQFVFRGIVLSNGTWSELGDAGETFGSQAGFVNPTANVPSGGGPLRTISGSLSNDFDVDVYQILIGDPTLATQEAFSATTVPDPGTGFAGANFDTVMYLFQFNFANNGNTRAGVGRCDDAAPGVIQSTLTAASLQPTHIPGNTYFLAVATPKARAVISGLGVPRPDMWHMEPSKIVYSGGIVYWVDPSRGQIGRADAATGALLAPLQVGTVPMQMSGSQSTDPNSRLLDSKIAVYDSGAGSKILFHQHGFGYETFRTCNLDGTGAVNLATTPGSNGASALAVDSVNGKMYWGRTIAGGSAEIYRSDINGNTPETVMTITDPLNSGESYIIESIAIDAVGGKIYWSQTVYDFTAGVYFPGFYVNRANLDGTNVQTLASNAKATSISLDVPGQKLYFASATLNKVGVINLTTLANTSFLTTTAPQGVAVDAASGKVYWSNPLERMLRRSATAAASIENWLSIGRDVGETPADGPGATNGLNSFVRDGTAVNTPLPYQIRLTGATFGNQGAMICKNNTTSVAQVGQPLPGTATLVSAAGTATGPIRISDAGTVAWVGTAGPNGLFLNSDNLINSNSLVNNLGTTGTGTPIGGVDRDTMDMSSNGQYLIASAGAGAAGALMSCVEISFVPDGAAGACCDVGGACQPLTAAVCASTSGNFLGVGMACVPDPCPQPGACCVTATGACSFALATACTGASTFVGGTICSPSPCPQGTGACCNGTSCTVTSQAACTGTFKGVNAVCGTVGNPTACCPANFNGVGGVSVQDIFAFLTAWFALNPSADFNGVGGITVADIFAFLTAWFAGCP